MSLASECWLAATGAIAPNATVPSPDRALELPLRLTNRITRWLKGQGEPRPWTPPKVQDPAKLRDRIVHTPDELPGAVELGDVLGAEWTQEVKDARASLLARWPGIPMRGGLASLEPPLAHDAASDWLALVAIVEDPLRLCDELEAGALLPAQLALFEEVYPELARVVTEAVFAAVVDLAAAKRELPEAREQGVRMILKTPPDAPVVLPQGEEPPPAKRAKAAGKEAAEGLQTVAQKTAG